MVSRVRTEDRGAVRWILLDRPDRHNALDLEMAREWATALAEAAGEPRVGAVVLAGEGSSFSSGGDLRAFRQAVDRQEYLAAIATVMGEGVVSMVTMPKAVVAAVHGNAMGVGFSMFLGADYKIAAEGARMAMSYINVGLTPGGGGTWMLTRLVGAARASALMLTGDPISAEEARDMGIVNRVVSPPGLGEAAQAVAEELAAKAPMALARTKELLWAAQGQPLPRQLALEAGLIGRSGATDEFDEASRAFFEGREPRFG